MSNGVKALIAGIVVFAALLAAGLYVATNFVFDTANDALDEATPLIEDAGEALENANEANEARQKALAECLAKADGSAKRIRACDEAAGSFP